MILISENKSSPNTLIFVKPLLNAGFINLYYVHYKIIRYTLAECGAVLAIPLPYKY
jgi:hypothetical protein